MRKRNMVEIDGKRYVTPKPVADCWHITHQAVTRACKEGRIIGAFRNTDGSYLIPVDAERPLDNDTIRKLLILLLSLKNRPNQSIDMSYLGNIIKTLRYLNAIGCIEDFDESNENIIYEVVLTDKGMRIATEGKPMNIDILNAGVTLVQVVASIITIAQVIS